MKKSQRVNSIFENVFKSADQQKSASDNAKDINELLATTLKNCKEKQDADKQALIPQKNCTVTKHFDSNVADSPMLQRSISPPPYSPLTPLLPGNACSKTSDRNVTNDDKVNDLLAQTSVNCVVNSPLGGSPLTPFLLRNDSFNILYDFNRSERKSSPVPPMTPETQKIVDSLYKTLGEEDISDILKNNNVNMTDNEKNHLSTLSSDTYIEDSDDSVKDPDYVAEDANFYEKDLDSDDNNDLDDFLHKNKPKSRGIQLFSGVPQNSPKIKSPESTKENDFQANNPSTSLRRTPSSPSILFSLQAAIDTNTSHSCNNVKSSDNTQNLQEKQSSRLLKRRLSLNDVRQQPSKRPFRSASTDGNLFSLQTSKGDLELKAPKRKRVADPLKWKRRIERNRRLKGQSYKTVKGKCKAAKPMKNPKCETLPKHKCSENVPKEMRENIYKSFRSLESVEQQRHFVIQHVTLSLKKRETTSGPSRKKFTNSYSFTVGEKKVKVCRDFFLDTLNITDGMVRGALAKVTSEGTLLPDRRGKRAPSNKLSDENLKYLEDHILSFPAMESHYCRKNSQYRYLDAKLNVTIMYEHYKKKCEEEEKTPVKLEKYRKVFRSFKLRFHVPKKDLCKKCVAFTEIKDDDSCNSEKELHAQHLKRRDSAFLRRDCDKIAAQAEPSTLAFNFDLQSVLQTPKGAAGPFFYVRKLAVYNLTFYNLGNKEVDCYTWDETEGKRGSTEIATAVYKYINNKSGITHVRMMSDNCGGQQKNYSFCCMLLYLIENHPTIETVDHVFFETGHSHMECDSVHSKIEQKSKNTPVYTPDGWVQIMRMARTNPRPFNVITLLHDDFIDFNSTQLQLAEDYSKKPKTPRNKNTIKKKRQENKSKANEEDKQTQENENQRKIKFTDAVWLQYRKNSPNSVFLKTDYENDDNFTEFKLKGKRGKIFRITPESVYTDRLQISQKKKTDLLKLCNDLQIPKAYHQYYASLPSSDAIVDRLPEPDATEEEENCF